MDVKAINTAVQNANKITVVLADRGLFVEAGVVHSLCQAVRVLHTDMVKLDQQNKQTVESESKMLGLLNQIVSDLKVEPYLHDETIDELFKLLGAELPKWKTNGWRAGTNPYPPELQMVPASGTMGPPPNNGHPLDVLKGADFAPKPEDID